eukprot:Pgem_evm1s8098
MINYNFTVNTIIDSSVTKQLKVAFENWKANFIVDNRNMCGFWLVADLVIYSVPLWLRLPLNHS